MCENNGASKLVIACLLLLLMFVLLPSSTVLAGLALSGAVWSASRWPVGHGEALEMLVFYGALSGLLVAYLG